ncbi:mannitol dehydrogenase family protein [Granulosicoccus sp.]|nr:mannitol dehydrogenase family protein [Granulosicoccus sp.]MDB4224791.1 mannitol dehydrogenase family protein [Granulosicoccus sp.]
MPEPECIHRFDDATYGSSIKGIEKAEFVMDICSEPSAVVALSLDALELLPSTVARPEYSRETMSAGILHFGPGNFHKAHQAVYLDRLLNNGVDHDWGIIGASVMSGDTKLREIMLEQDLLSTVVTQSATVSEAQVIGPMLDYLPIGDGDSILATMANPAIRIVSLTVTEGGYFVNAVTGKFDEEHPDIRADVGGFDNPKTVFGLIVKGLEQRRLAGQKPFTIMSCDNLPHNGHAARNAVVGFAKLVDESLAQWISENSSFPNGMVDRITPATGDFEREQVQTLFGVNDQAPVFCEDYIQWVLEDNFVAGRPSFEQAGVEIVPDVAPYETMKIRILNGGHAVLAYPAALLGIEFAHEALQDKIIYGFLETIELNEIIPVVPDVPGIDLNDYYQSVVSRFSNPAIADTINRLCFDGTNRQPKFIATTISDRLDAGASIDGLALASAFWCRYCEGTDEAGNDLPPNDPNWDHLHATAMASRTDPLEWLSMTNVYGNLGQNVQFQKSFSDALVGVRDKGVVSMIQAYCNRFPG